MLICLFHIVIFLLYLVCILLKLLIVLALRMTLRLEPLLILLVGHLIGFEDILELMDLLHIVFVNALEFTCFEAFEEVVCFELRLFEVVVFSRAFGAKVKVAFLVVVLAVLRNDALVVAARLPLGPEVVVLDSAHVLDFGVQRGLRVDELGSRLVHLHVRDEFLDRVAVEFGLVGGCVRYYVDFGSISGQNRWWSRRLRGWHL